MKKIIIFLLFIFNCASCKAQLNPNNLIKLEVVINSLGKTNFNIKMLENATGVSAKHFTTNIYFRTLNDLEEINSFPINDLVFNYSYFYENIYRNLKNKKANIYLREFKYSGKLIQIIEKIE